MLIWLLFLWLWIWLLNNNWNGERELASRADQRVLRWFGHVERMVEYRMAGRMLMAEVSGGRVRGRPRGTRETETSGGRVSDLTWLPLLGVGRKSWYIIIIIEKYSWKLEAYTDRKVWVFSFIWSMRWYVHCMLDYLLHAWLSSGEWRF